MWQDVIFAAGDAWFLADAIARAVRPATSSAPWRAGTTSLILLSYAAAGWTLGLRAWTLVTLASALAWVVLATRSRAQKISCKADARRHFRRALHVRAQRARRRPQVVDGLSCMNCGALLVPDTELGGGRCGECGAHAF